MGQSSNWPAQSSDPSFTWAITGLSESSPTHYQNCAPVCSMFFMCTCTLVCICWLENCTSSDVWEVDEGNLPIWKESWKQAIVIIKQGDDRLSIKTSLLHLSSLCSIYILLLAWLTFDHNFSAVVFLVRPLLQSFLCTVSSWSTDYLPTIQ